MHRYDAPPPRELLSHGPGGVEGEDWGDRDPRWVGVTTRWMDVGGHPVRTLTYEGDDAGDGPPQLLVHGLGGSCTNWIEVIPELGRRGPVVAPDLPGFGLTPVPEDGTARVPANAAFVKALIRTLDWHDFELHGNSMGGMISILVAAELGDRIRGLVLIDPAMPSPLNRAHEADTAMLVRFAPFTVPMVGRYVMRAAWRRTPLERMLDDTLPLIYADPSAMRPPIREIRLADMAFGREHPWRVDALAEATRSLTRLIMSRSKLLAALDAIDVPTFLVWGSEDRLVGRQVIDLIIGRKPEFDLHVLPGIGHAPMVEAPETFLSALDAWRGRAGI